jgi:putative colanic acid biosynthesis UDP-glucose lipid carrier transferase
MIPKKQKVVFSNILVEFILLNVSIFTVFFLKNFLFTKSNDSVILLSEVLLFVGLFNLVWGFIILINRDQDFYISNGHRKKIKSFILSTFMFIGIISTIAIIFKVEYFNRTTFVFPILLFSVLNIISFGILADINRRKSQGATLSKALLVGSASKWKNIHFIANSFREKGLNLVGFIDVDGRKSKLDDIEILGGLKDLENILDDQPVDELFIMGGTLSEKATKSIVKIADYKGKRINIIPEAPIFAGNILKPYSLDGIPLFQYRQTPLDEFSNYFLKRVFDVFFSLSVLIALTPLFIIIGIIILADGKGPIFYKPLRKGEAGNVFKCYKFRTMRICDDPVNGTRSTIKNDPRITLIGKYLRKFDLDELPQFFNVLKGDMSVVGPRPHRVNLDLDFRKIVNDYMVRHYVKPGITGWAQVNGWRGPTVTAEQKRKRVWHDLWYIENWNFILDIKIIFLTVFSRKTRVNAF